LLRLNSWYKAIREPVRAGCRAEKIVQNGKGELVFNATYLLNTMQIRKTIQGSDFKLESTDYYETQVFRVGYHWKF
jgi:hypothetical protein